MQKHGKLEMTVSKKILHMDAINEMVCNHLLNALILQHICPHFALSYYTVFSDRFGFTRKTSAKT